MIVTVAGIAVYFIFIFPDLSSFDIFPFKFVKNMAFIIKLKDIQQLKGQT